MVESDEVTWKESYKSEVLGRFEECLANYVGPAGEDYEYLVKMILVGDSGAGKSGYLLRIGEDRFEFEDWNMGVDWKIRRVRCASKHVKLQVWHPANPRDCFCEMMTGYYRSAHICRCYMTLQIGTAFRISICGVSRSGIVVWIATMWLSD